MPSAHYKLEPLALSETLLNSESLEGVTAQTLLPTDAYLKAVDKTGFEALLTRNGFKI